MDPSSCPPKATILIPSDVFVVLRLPKKWRLGQIWPTLTLSKVDTGVLQGIPLHLSQFFQSLSGAEGQCQL